MLPSDLFCVFLKFIIKVWSGGRKRRRRNRTPILTILLLCMFLIDFSKMPLNSSASIYINTIY